MTPRRSVNWVGSERAIVASIGPLNWPFPVSLTINFLFPDNTLLQSRALATLAIQVQGRFAGQASVSVFRCWAFPCCAPQCKFVDENRRNRLDASEKTLTLALGFLITTVLGGMLGYLLNRRSWQIQTQHEIYRARFDEGIGFLDEISILVGRRFFALQRFFWALQDGDVDKIAEREREYFLIVAEWNAQFWRNRNKIRLLVGEAQANRFLNYADDYTADRPTSVHYEFVFAHRKVTEAKTNPVLAAEAKAEIDRLNRKCSVFLEQLTSDFLKRAATLQLFKLPTSPGGAEMAAESDKSRLDP